MRNRLAALTLTGVALFGLSACMSIPIPTTSSKQSAPSDSVAPSAPAQTTPKETPSTPQWAVVATLSGSADQQSDTIKLTGGKVRVTYEFTDTAGIGMVVGAIYVLPEGTDIMVDGGIPVVMISKAGAGDTILRKAAGEYYVKVAAANSEYTVTVEEEK